MTTQIERYRMASFPRMDCHDNSHDNNLQQQEQSFHDEDEMMNNDEDEWLFPAMTATSCDIERNCDEHVEVVGMVSPISIINQIPLNYATTGHTRRRISAAVAAATAFTAVACGSDSSPSLVPSLVEDDVDNDDVIMNSIGTEECVIQTLSDSVNNERMIEKAMERAMHQGQHENNNSDNRNGVVKLSDTCISIPRVPLLVSESYGGLENLGNTCYMGSALQMLASLDTFVQRLANDETPTSSPEASQLRLAFFVLMQRLAQGETVGPEAFKAAMDARTPLFVGYRQHDAHEFLTTLLDLLDGDYKVSSNNRGSDSDSDRNDGVSNGHSNVSELPANEHTIDQHNEITDVRMENAVEEASEHDGAMLGTNEDCPSSSGFADLGIEGINQLLHGYPTNRPSLTFPALTSSPAAIEPRCKLIGGRMNTADMKLSPLSEYDDCTMAHPAALSVATTDEARLVEGDVMADSPLSSEPNSGVCTLSPIEATFTTVAQVRLTCDSCKYTRCHTETFLHLSLEINSIDHGNATIHDGLRRFFAPERREIKCERCFCDSATQTMQITHLPKALLLHLKRFLVDVSPDYSSVTYRKNQLPVEFDVELSIDDDQRQEQQHPSPSHHSVLAEFLAPDCALPAVLPPSAGVSEEMANKTPHEQQHSNTIASKSYKLRSVVHHIGSSASCGHYTADAYRRYQDVASNDKSNSNSKNNSCCFQFRQWTRFNDASVSRISEQQSIYDQTSRSTAYLILYEWE